MNNNNLKNSVAIVTGGAMGIGEEISRELAERGATVIICDIADDAALSVVNGINSENMNAEYIKVDVTKEKQILQVFEKVFNKYGRIDILVNNAGLTRGTALQDIPEEEWDLIMDVNLKAPFLWIKNVYPFMKRNAYGRIVNMSSIAAIAGGGFVGTAHYAASKAGLVALTKAAAKNFGKDGITVNAVAPGPIRTRMSSWVDEKEDEVARTIPVKRIGETQDIAGAVCYITSKEAGFITGHTLIVDGGVTIASAKNIV